MLVETFTKLKEETSDPEITIKSMTTLPQFMANITMSSVNKDPAMIATSLLAAMILHDDDNT
jgi:hypothetical protein